MRGHSGKHLVFYIIPVKPEVGLVGSVTLSLEVVQDATEMKQLLKLSANSHKSRLHPLQRQAYEHLQKCYTLQNALKPRVKLSAAIHVKNFNQ